VAGVPRAIAPDEGKAVTVTMTESTTTLDGREFLLLTDGSLLRVVSADGELIPWARYESQRAEATARRCGCGRVCGSPSSQTCGSAECIANLHRTASA
jgi:hypothetical protein